MENNTAVLMSYRCRDIGYGVETGVVEGSFTGEQDIWGKLTFETVGGHKLYLFEDEICAVDSVEEL